MLTDCTVQCTEQTQRSIAKRTNHSKTEQTIAKPSAERFFTAARFCWGLLGAWTPQEEGGVGQDQETGGIYGPQAGNPAGLNNDRGLVGVKPGNPLCLLDKVEWD